ncbi:hypothetical protein ACKGJO_06710 [Gracilimonas sp. Q87]|uniref:hypothetical protein n=1 Tax=Gracilimonas sp. Q87 TaxID=3384766 RepID=UPI003984394F
MSDQTIQPLPTKICITFKFGFFVHNAGIEIFNKAMDEIGFPAGESYRREKFGLMQRNTTSWMGCLDNRYLTKLEPWVDEYVRDYEKQWEDKLFKELKK